MKFLRSRFRKRNSKRKMTALEADDVIPIVEDERSNTDWWDQARQMMWNVRQNFCPADYDEYTISDIPQLDERELLTTKLCFLLYGQPKGKGLIIFTHWL